MTVVTAAAAFAKLPRRNGLSRLLLVLLELLRRPALAHGPELGGLGGASHQAQLAAAAAAAVTTVAAAFAKLLLLSGLGPLLLRLLDAASESCPGSQGTFCAAPEFYIEFQCHTEAVVAVAAAVPPPPPLPLLLG